MEIHATPRPLAVVLILLTLVSALVREYPIEGRGAVQS